MTIQIGLLRAVNLGAHNKVGMSELRGLLAELGMQDVRSLLQSGNVVFRSEARGATRLERLLEEAVRRRLGLETDIFVRTAEDWSAVVDGNPFPKEAARDPGHLLVMFLKQAPGHERVKALEKRIIGREIVRAAGRHMYIVYRDGIGRSRLTTASIEKALGTRGTGRNWNTVLKLGEMSGALAPPP